VLVELRDAVVGADAVRDVDVAGAIPGDVARTAERRSRNAGARGPAAAATAFAAAPLGCRATSLGSAAARFTTAAGAWLPRAHVDRFRLPAEHERDAAFRIELHDLRRRSIDRPDVVLRIDAQADR